MKIISAFIISIILLGCNTKTEYISRSEKGRVLQTIYTPPYHYSDTDLDIDSDGNIKLVPATVHVRAQYGVVFECEHGQFVIIGSSSYYQKLWEKLPKNSNVTILYNEEYLIHIKNKEEVSRELVDYDFVDAYVLEKE